MDWNNFSEKINGEFQTDTSTFIGGDIIIKRITKEDECEKFQAEKIIRRSYGESSHNSLEKIEFRYFVSKIDFGKNRIVRKSVLKRLIIDTKNHFIIEGEKTDILNLLSSSKELDYLLRHPKSEFITVGNIIYFRTQFIGEIKEDLSEIYNSMEKLKKILLDLYGAQY